MQTRYMNRAATLVARYEGSNSSSMARIVANRGEIYRKFGRLDEAEKQFREALLLYEQNGESDGVNAASTANGLAITLRAGGRNVEALGLLRRVVATKERLIGLTQETLDAYLNLANAEWNTGVSDPDTLIKHSNEAIRVVNHTIRLLVDSDGPTTPLLCRRII